MTHRIALAADLFAGLFAVLAPTVAPAASRDPADLPAGRYALDRPHSSVIAQVTHLGVSLYTVRFDGFDADLTYDPAHPEATRVRASVDATSLDAGAPYSRKFADDFLAARRYPSVTFVSDQIAANPDRRTGTMTGGLTLAGVTRSVAFDVTFIGVGGGLLGAGTVTGFSAQARIRRSDFGSTYLAHWVGDEVTVIIDAEFDRK